MHSTDDELKVDLNHDIRELKDEMQAGEVRVNRRIDALKDEMQEMKVELREEMSEVKDGSEMKELKTLLIQTLQLSPAAKP